MYIRAVRQVNKKTGKVYWTYRLVESYRNYAGKARQRSLLNLGSNFSIPKEKWKMLADRIEEIHHGQSRLFDLEDEAIEKEAQRIAKLIASKYSDIKKAQTEEKDYQTVDVNSLDNQQIRKVGAEHVAHHAAKQLELPDILKDTGLNKKQTDVALGSIIGRLVHPGSELNTHRYLKEQSALDEIIGTDFSNLPLKSMYKITDLLLKHKSEIETKLYSREKDLFNLEETITLYDLTNTYFEGRCLDNPKAQYGHSKEKRTDCCLVTLGMVLDSSGFPKKSEIYSGNISEPKTLQDILKNLTEEKATVVMDAGIATEENIKWLKDNEYKYIVVSRKQKISMPDSEEIIVKKTRNNIVKASLIKNEETKELELYCHSSAMEAKNKQMVSKAEERYELKLKNLSNGLTKKGCTKKYEKILESIGRLKEKHKRISRRYDISIKTDEKKKLVTAITWKKIEKTSKQSGVYCLRTNRDDLDAETFWQTYTMLTDLEAAFCSLKSELGFRPVYHQKEKRVDGHLFVSVIAYHLLHTIRYQLKMKGINASWDTLRELLSTQCRITSTLQLENGKTLQIRKSSSPDANQLSIYNALGLGLHPGKTEKIYVK